jgi:hypothetical protein
MDESPHAAGMVTSGTVRVPYGRAQNLMVMMHFARHLVSWEHEGIEQLEVDELRWVNSQARETYENAQRVLAVDFSAVHADLDNASSLIEITDRLLAARDAASHLSAQLHAAARELAPGDEHESKLRER